MTTKNQARASGQSATFLILLGGIFVLLNVLGLFFNLRSDWTKRELFSLSKGSMHLASTLKDRMEIVAYFSPDLPPPHNATERYVRDLLTEYKDASKGKIALRFVHPEKDEDKQAAERDGVHRVQDQKLEADSFSVHEGFRGVAFRYLGDTRAIAQVDDTDGLEYEITQIIKEMTGEKVKIGVLAGKNPEPAPNPMQMQMGMPPQQGGVKLNSLKGYMPTYDVQEVKADKEIPTELKALLIVQPEQAFTDSELRYIDQYVMRGGSLAVFGGSMKVDTAGGAPSAAPVETGLNKLLDKWGVSMQSKIVADAQCGRARMPTNFGIPIAVPYPPVPIIGFEEYQQKHPVLFRLDQTAVPFITPLALNDSLKGDKQVKRTILAQSTKYAWLMEGATIDLKARERWEVPKERQSFVLGVAIEGNLPSAFSAAAVSSPEGGDAAASNIKAPARAEKPVHVLVFGSGYFMRDEFLPQPQGGARNIPGGAAALALNAVDWLAQDSDLIEIRAKSVEDPSLEVPQNVKEAEATIREAIGEQNQDKADKAFKERKDSMAAWDGKKTSYRWGNTLGIPLVFALFGVIRWRVRKAKRANLKL